MEIGGGRDKAREGLEKSCGMVTQLARGKESSRGFQNFVWGIATTSQQRVARTMLLRLGRVVKAWGLDA